MAPLSPAEYRELDYDGHCTVEDEAAAALLVGRGCMYVDHVLHTGQPHYKRTELGLLAVRVHRAFLAATVLA